MPTFRLVCLFVVLLLVGAACTAGTDEPYTYEPPSPGGTGKLYMGREIAAVTDTQQLGWMQRPARQDAELPDRLVRALDLRPADVVADIGAGTGYFTFRIAPLVPNGRVYAVDIQEEMLELIAARADAAGLRQVVPVQGSITDPNLPRESVDVALIVASYHEFSHPREMIGGIRRALKPGGRLVLVEYRGEDPTIAVPALRRMTVAQARKEMEAAGLVWRTTKDILPQQHLMVFEKPSE